MVQRSDSQVRISTQFGKPVGASSGILISSYQPSIEYKWLSRTGNNPAITQTAILLLSDDIREQTVDQL